MSPWRGRVPSQAEVRGRDVSGTRHVPSSPYDGSRDSNMKVGMVPTLGDRPGWSVGHGEDMSGMRWRGPGTGASSPVKFALYFPPPAPVKSRTPFIFQIFIVNKFCDIAGAFPRAGAERGARGVSGSGVSGSGDGGSPARAKQERETRRRRSGAAQFPPPPPRPGAPSRLRAVAQSEAVRHGGAAGGEFGGAGGLPPPPCACVPPPIAACQDGALRLSLPGGGSGGSVFCSLGSGSTGCTPRPGRGPSLALPRRHRLTLQR